MREIRLALLEADVNLQVVKDFVARVKERGVGEEVTKSLTPGQEVVKIVHEELTAMMGGGDSRLAFAPRGETVILLAGLQGSGKTTAAAKLALMLRKEGRTPALVAADLQRPAAIDQLEQLGRQIQVPVFGEERKDPVEAAEQGVEWGVEQGADVVIVDTAGRHQVDADLMDELGRIAGSDSADERPARSRLDDGARGGERRARVPGAGRLRRDRADEARRRRARRRGPVRPRRHRTADQARVRRREARPARVVPPRPDGVPDPRHGRRADADREGRGGGRGRRAGRDGAPPARRRVHVRRLPGQLQDAAAHGAAERRALDDPRGRQPAEGARRSTSASWPASRRSSCR